MLKEYDGERSIEDLVGEASFELDEEVVTFRVCSFVVVYLFYIRLSKEMALCRRGTPPTTTRFK